MKRSDYNVSIRRRKTFVPIKPDGPYCGSEEARIIARRFFPNMTREDHKAAAEKAAHRSVMCSGSWSFVADRAAWKEFGRGFMFNDYQIAGIGRSEFPDRTKEILRRLAHANSFWGSIAAFHRRAATMRPRRQS